MKIIAVVAGGYSGEYDISLRSAEMVMQTINKKKFESYKVVISKNAWEVWDNGKKYTVDKNDFSFTKAKKRIKFDAAYIILHGTPGEDGKLQGYLDMIGVPYTSPGMFESAVTMNKYISKKICGDAGLNVAKSILVRSSQATIDIDKMVKILGLPCFVKPNNGGSSVATTKAYTKAQLVNGMEEAFQHDDEVIVEQFIKGREVTCGVFFNGKDIVALPVTEIIPLNDFFDYEAKYEGKSNEVTPAEINANTYKKIQEKTIEVYRLLNLSGMVRIDFMLKGATPYFMEVNTIPGFSKASIIPQQIRAAGLKESDVITMLIEQTLRQKK